LVEIVVMVLRFQNDPEVQTHGHDALSRTTRTTAYMFLSYCTATLNITSFASAVNSLFIFLSVFQYYITAVASAVNTLFIFVSVFQYYITAVASAVNSFFIFLSIFYAYIVYFDFLYHRPCCRCG
jgi:magnesium-transporting ATPase (P-type)